MVAVGTRMIMARLLLRAWFARLEQQIEAVDWGSNFSFFYLFSFFYILIYSLDVAKLPAKLPEILPAKLKNARAEIASNYCGVDDFFACDFACHFACDFVCDIWGKKLLYFLPEIWYNICAGF